MLSEQDVLNLKLIITYSVKIASKIFLQLPQLITGMEMPL